MCRRRCDLRRGLCGARAKPEGDVTKQVGKYLLGAREVATLVGMTPAEHPSPAHSGDTDSDASSATAGTNAATEFAITRHHPGTNWAVVVPTMVVVIGVVAWGLAGPGSFAQAAHSGFAWVTGSLGWLFVLVTTACVLFVLYLGLSRYGSIRIGKDHEKPEFKTSSWIAMMFAAGMGIGLMFFGVSEPLAHFHTPPPGVDSPRAGAAMATTAFHWTLHPWATYAVVALVLGLTAYRYGRSNLISQAMVPLIGERRARRGLGTALDVFTIIATIFGTAASLGLGALQIQTGLVETGTISVGGTSVVVGVILVLGAAYLVSAASGVSKGIQLLSNINMVLALVLAVFVAVASGALVYILDLVPTTLGTYLADFLAMSSRTGASQNGEAAEWLNSWTIFYWAWWVSWSPFVGMFLARISRGRTIRQFVAGVVLVPSALSIVWFAIFGGTALHLEQLGSVIKVPDGQGTEKELFTLFRDIPGTPLLMFVAMLLIAIFFITSADSASVVMGGMGQYGVDNPQRWITVMFGLSTGGIAVVMLLAGGGNDDALTSLQNLTIVAASPYIVILIALMVSIYRMLHNDETVTAMREMSNPRAWRRLHATRGGHRVDIRETKISVPEEIANPANPANPATPATDSAAGQHIP